MITQIHEQKDWPALRWDVEALTKPLANVSRRQGRLIGRMEGLGFKLREEAVLRTLTEDVIKSSEIEGEILEPDQVRSSIARRLGMNIAGLTASERHVDGVVEMLIDATRNYSEKLTDERLFGWHAALFPTGYSGMSKVTVGAWRNDVDGPMQVVSGPIGKQRVHFTAPEAKRLPNEMKEFLAWFENNETTDQIVKAAIAHFWFVTIHPFEDGNGRIARAIADMALARAENSAQRFYSMSSQIRTERNAYYEILEATQKGSLDITAWLSWFLNCLDRAFDNAETLLAGVLAKAKFWERHRDKPLNERQHKVLNRLLDGFDGKLNTSKWAKLTKVSQDTAARDINDLIEKHILWKDSAGGRSTSYSLILEDKTASQSKKNPTG